MKDSTQPRSVRVTSSKVGTPSLGQLPLGGTYTAEHLGHFCPTIFPSATASKNLVVADPAVYVPPRGSCPRDGIPTSEEVTLTDRGCVESFTVVHIPIPGNPIEPPFVSAMIRLDGANISFLHLIQEIPVEEIRIGMRVEAVWKPQGEWTTSLENIKWFKPTGEPDIKPESLIFKPK